MLIDSKSTQLINHIIDRLNDYQRCLNATILRLAYDEGKLHQLLKSIAIDASDFANQLSCKLSDHNREHSSSTGDVLDPPGSSQNRNWGSINLCLAKAQSTCISYELALRRKGMPQDCLSMLQVQLDDHTLQMNLLKKTAYQ